MDKIKLKNPKSEKHDLINVQTTKDFLKANIESKPVNNSGKKSELKRNEWGRGGVGYVNVSV